jgi:hypothetical protein
MITMLPWFVMTSFGPTTFADRLLATALVDLGGARPKPRLVRGARSASLDATKSLPATKSQLLSFDHLVGEREQSAWDGQAERLGGLEINRHLEFGRLLDW